MGEYTKVNNGISMRKIIKTIKRFFKGIYIHFQEKEYKGRLHYIYENNHADKLMIVFSGFSPYKPMYNYMRTLKNVKSIDKLFLLDDFGYRGSYYLMENGKDTPKQLVTELVKTIVGGVILRNYSQWEQAKEVRALSTLGYSSMLPISFQAHANI